MYNKNLDQSSVYSDLPLEIEQAINSPENMVVRSHHLRELFVLTAEFLRGSNSVEKSMKDFLSYNQLGENNAIDKVSVDLLERCLKSTHRHHYFAGGN